MPIATIQEYLEDLEIEVEVEIDFRITDNYKGDRFCPPTLDWEIERVDVHTLDDEDLVKQLEVNFLDRAKTGEFDEAIVEAASDWGPLDYWDR